MAEIIKKRKDKNHKNNKYVGALGRKVVDMSDSGAIREYSTSGVSTFLHHTDVGEAIKQVTFERDIYLGVAKIFGLKNKEYLMENLQGLKVGDRVTLYRKYNSEDESCTAVAVSSMGCLYNSDITPDYHRL